MKVPTRVRLEATSACQLRCPSCPTAAGYTRPTLGTGSLTPDDFRRFLAKSPSIQSIELSNYGELFLNSKLLKIMEIADECGIALCAKNGANLNHLPPEVAEGLVRYRFRYITCSIDGASQETYSQYRVGGDFDRVLENIKTINRWKKHYASPFPELAWQFVVFGHNEHEIEKAESIANELGMKLYLKLSWDDDLSPIRDRERLRKYLGWADRDEYREASGKSYLQGLCHQLWDQPQVNWDGKNLGCGKNFWGDFGGDAFEIGMPGIHSHPKMEYARQMLLGHKPPREDIPCSSCDIYKTMQSTGKWLDRRKTTALVSRFWGKVQRRSRHWRKSLSATSENVDAF